MNILLACEESQAVCIEMRKRGHKAFSCDVLPCSGGRPEWHLQGDVLEQLDKGWDMLIGFPPCTHLAVSGAAWFAEKIKDGRQQEGVDFFMSLAQAPISKIALENPIGIMSSKYRKPDQIVHPYYFGDPYSKKTCIWVKGLSPLRHCPEDDLFAKKTHVEKGEFMEVTRKDGRKEQRAKWMCSWPSEDPNRGKTRSKTFPGIARAMAEQWG